MYTYQGRIVTIVSVKDSLVRNFGGRIHVRLQGWHCYASIGSAKVIQTNIFIISVE